MCLSGEGPLGLRLNHFQKQDTSTLAWTQSRHAKSQGLSHPLRWRGLQLDCMYGLRQGCCQGGMQEGTSWRKAARNAALQAFRSAGNPHKQDIALGHQATSLLVQLSEINAFKHPNKFESAFSNMFILASTQLLHHSGNGQIFYRTCPHKARAIEVLSKGIRRNLCLISPRADLKDYFLVSKKSYK